MDYVGCIFLNNQKSPPRRNPYWNTFVPHVAKTMDVAMGVSSHVGAAVTAVVELGDDVESIGHGQGMLLLVSSCKFNFASRGGGRSGRIGSCQSQSSVVEMATQTFFYIERVLSTSLLALAALPWKCWKIPSPVDIMGPCYWRSMNGGN